MKKKSHQEGFTLIELLTVIAIIGILAAIIIPTVSSVRTSANKAKSKAQFSQWAVAMDLFRQEYGYYPQVDGGSGNKVDAQRFVGALSARELDGDKLASTSEYLIGNKKMLSFYSVSSSDLNSETSPTLLVDAFGNTDIAVIYDKNGDGRLTTADGAKPNVAAVDETPVSPDFVLSATEGPRVPVVFYSAGKGKTQTDIVYSWK